MNKDLHKSFELSKAAKRGAVLFLHKKGLNPTQISKQVRMTRTSVYKWINKGDILPARRKQYKHKLKDVHLKYMVEKAANKQTIKECASSRSIQSQLLSKFNVHVCHTTVNNHLNRILTKPIRLRKTFFLSCKNQDARKHFIEYINANNIEGKDIFFTDEKRFMFHRHSNSQTNRIRLTQDSKEKLRNGDQEMVELLTDPVKKYEEGFMVAGGLSYYGVSKLVFCVGTMNSFSYSQTLEFFANDVKELNENLFFQQDNATCHVSKESKEFICRNFNRTLLKWPANSPDLSPIELLWSIMEHELSKKTYASLEEKKLELVRIWNNTPIELCQKLISTFDQRIKTVYENDGKRYLEIRKKRRTNTNIAWKQIFDQCKIENVCYNDEQLEEIHKKTLKSITRRIKREKINYISECRTAFGNTYVKHMLHSWLLRAKQQGFSNDFYGQTIKPLEMEKTNIENMTYEEFINYLSPKQKLKLTAICPKYCSDEESTNADEESEGRLD